jgi:MOSC domain-containing protein YiiM
MPKEGIFVRILTGGYIKPGDTIEFIEAPEAAELFYS